MVVTLYSRHLKTRWVCNAALLHLLQLIDDWYQIPTSYVAVLPLFYAVYQLCLPLLPTPQLKRWSLPCIRKPPNMVPVKLYQATGIQHDRCMYHGSTWLLMIWLAPQNNKTNVSTGAFAPKKKKKPFKHCRKHLAEMKKGHVEKANSILERRMSYMQIFCH